VSEVVTTQTSKGALSFMTKYWRSKIDADLSSKGFSDIFVYFSWQVDIAESYGADCSSLERYSDGKAVPTIIHLTRSK